MIGVLLAGVGAVFTADAASLIEQAYAARSTISSARISFNQSFAVEEVATQSYIDCTFDGASLRVDEHTSTSRDGYFGGQAPDPVSIQVWDGTQALYQRADLPLPDGTRVNQFYRLPVTTGVFVNARGVGLPVCAELDEAEVRSPFVNIEQISIRTDGALQVVQIRADLVGQRGVRDLDAQCELAFDSSKAGSLVRFDVAFVEGGVSWRYCGESMIDQVDGRWYPVHSVTEQYRDGAFAWRHELTLLSGEFGDAIPRETFGWSGLDARSREVVRDMIDGRAKELRDGKLIDWK